MEKAMELLKSSEVWDLVELPDNCKQLAASRLVEAKQKHFYLQIGLNQSSVITLIAAQQGLTLHQGAQ